MSLNVTPSYVTLSIAICHEVMGMAAMIFAFRMLSFMPAFSLSSFTFIKRLFSFSPWRHFLFPFLSFLYHEGPHFNNVV